MARACRRRSIRWSRSRSVRTRRCRRSKWPSETTQQAAACSGSACFYNTTLSFRDAHSPLPMEHNPRKVFIQLFGEGDTPRGARGDLGSDEEPARSRPRSHQRAARDLGAGDRVVLDNYVETVREIERRVQLASSRDLSAIEVPEAPIGELNAVRLAGRSAVRSDRAGLPGRPDARRLVHHGGRRHQPHLQPHRRVRLVPSGVASRQRSEPDREAGEDPDLARGALCRVRRASSPAIPDGDGTLLDHSMFLYGSNMSNSDRHNGHPLPTILVGGGNGTLKGSQHIELREPTPLANLHLTILDKINAKQDSFGDSTGLIAGV